MAIDGPRHHLEYVIGHVGIMSGLDDTEKFRKGEPFRPIAFGGNRREIGGDKGPKVNATGHVVGGVDRAGGVDLADGTSIRVRIVGSNFPHISGTGMAIDTSP